MNAKTNTKTMDAKTMDAKKSNAKRIAIGGLTAGFLFSGWGLVLRDSGPAEPAVDPADSPVLSLASGPDGPMLSTDQRVELFEARVAASPAGYLDRTSLGVALAARAREQADLTGYEASEAVLREALAVNPGHEPAKLALAQALHSQHRFSEAASLVDEVRAGDPDSLQALALAGDVQFELGEYAAAAELYQQLARSDRSAPVLSRLSRLAYVFGDTERALELAEEGVTGADAERASAEDRAFHRFQLGHVRWSTGDVDGAVVALEEALTISPGHPGATELLANVYDSIGRDDEAAELYRELVDGGGAADLYGRYADLVRAGGDPWLADQLERQGADLAAETIDRFPAERRHLAGYFMTRDPATALALAEADLADRHDIGAYDTLAWALYHSGRYEDAAVMIAAALAPGVQDPTYLYHAGAIAAATGDVEAARTHLDAALSISTSFHPTEAAEAITLRASLG